MCLPRSDGGSCNEEPLSIMAAPLSGSALDAKRLFTYVGSASTESTNNRRNLILVGNGEFLGRFSIVIPPQYTGN
jgi:hypothetical protein